MASVSRAFSKARHGARRLIKSLTGKKASKGNGFIARLYRTAFPQLEIIELRFLAQDKDRIFLIPVINARIPILKNKMNWGERVFLTYQMKVLKLFSDKLFYLIIAEMPDFIVAN